MRLLLPTTLLPLLCATAIAQAPGPNWLQFPTGGTEPPLRRENPGAADNNYMYAFGGTTGNSGGSRVNDLWQFDGATWTQMTADGAVGSPAARHQAGVTWDFARNKLVVFGGQDAGGTVLADTWEWDPGTNAWTDITPLSGPTARRFTAMSYDPTTTGLVMFGGLDSSGAHLNDTWLFLGGTTWVPMSTAVVPSTRRQHHLVTRPDVGDVLLFGGQEASLPAPTKWRTDTFTWDGSDWTQIVTATLPQGVVANDATYDQLRQRIVLPAGNGTTGQFNSVAEFDSLTNDWVMRTGLGYYSRFFLAYVPALGKTFKVSGQGNGTPLLTYEYQSDVIATSTPTGAGCAGMALTADSDPWTGRDWNVTGTGFGTGSLGLTVLGLGTLSLPISNILPAGGPGCDLLVTTDALQLIVPAAGQASYTFSIPANPIFANFALNLQMVSLDFTGSAITTINSTNAINGVVGAL